MVEGRTSYLFYSPAHACPLVGERWALAMTVGFALGTIATTVRFSFYGSDGAETWSAWYDHVSWRVQQRRRLDVALSPSDLTPGTYQVGTTIRRARIGSRPRSCPPMAGRLSRTT